jgi:hypothetical protein
MGDRTVRNRIRLIVALLAGSFLSVLVSAGCSESKESQAGRTLSDAVNLSRRHCERAIGLMGGLTFKAGDELSPINKAVNVEQIAVEPSYAVNPKALDALKQAKDVLSKAMASATDAPAESVAQANFMMGQINAMTGDYYAALSRSARTRALASFAENDIAADAIGSGVALMKYFDAMATVSDEDLTKEINDATAEAQKAQADQQDAQTKSTDLKKQLDELNAANQKLLTESADLRVKSEGAKGVKMLELFDEAIKKENEAAANGTKIGDLERQLGILKSDTSSATLRLKAATARQVAAQKTLDQRKLAAKSVSQEKEKVVGQVAERRKNFETSAGSLATSFEEAKAAQAEAIKSYAQATDSFRKAGMDRDAKASLGATEQSKAMAELSLLTLNSQLAGLAADCDRIFKDLNQDVPPPVAKIKGLLIDTAKAYDAAATDYDQAATAFGQAASQSNTDPVIRRTQWIYQVQKAGALGGVARTSPDAAKRAAALKDARQIITDALNGKENSPYVVEALKLKQALTETEGAGPASSPAVAPTSAPSTSAPSTSPTSAASSPS